MIDGLHVASLHASLNFQPSNMILPPPIVSKKRDERLQIIKGFKTGLLQRSFAANAGRGFYIERKSLRQNVSAGGIVLRITESGEWQINSASDRRSRRVRRHRHYGCRRDLR